MLTANKNQLIEHLEEIFTEIKDDKKIIEKIKLGMGGYKVLPGQVQKYINGQFDTGESLEDLGWNLICLLAEQTHIASGKSRIDPKKYFTEREIKEIKSNFEGYVADKIDFPYTFENVIKISDDDYITSIKASEIKRLFEQSLLQYNAETQREMRQTKKRDSDEIIETPKVIEKSVKEMEALLEKGEIISSMITFNARLGTSDDGDELEYDESKKSLTVTQGTLLDVLDGFHRINAITRALRKNPSIDTMFKLNILNFDKRRAQKFFSQLNSQNPIGSGHLKKMAESRQADFIAKQIQSNSELSGKVAAGDHIAPNSDLLVTFNVLSDGIDEIFKVEDKATAIKTSQYLTEFFNTLFYSFPDEFLGDISGVRKDSLVNANSIFYGYIQLAKRMQDKNISNTNITNIIGKIDFSRNNKLWQEYNIVDNNLRINTKAKKQIIKLFNDIKID